MKSDELADILDLRSRLWPAVTYATREDAAADAQLWLRLLCGYQPVDVEEALIDLAAQPECQVYAPDARRVAHQVRAVADRRRRAEMLSRPAEVGEVASVETSRAAIAAARQRLAGANRSEP